MLNKNTTYLFEKEQQTLNDLVMLTKGADVQLAGVPVYGSRKAIRAQQIRIKKHQLEVLDLIKKLPAEILQNYRQEQQKSMCTACRNSLGMDDVIRCQNDIFTFITCSMIANALVEVKEVAA